MKYEDVVREVCGDNWQEDEESRDGGLGVAMMCSFLKGRIPILDELSYDLDVDKRDLKESFDKLLKSGMFGKTFNAKGDNELLGKGFSPPKNYIVGASKETKNWWTYEQAFHNAWCHIEAIASGRIERNIAKNK